MRGRSAGVLVLAASLLTVPAACSSPAGGPPLGTGATGGTSTGGTNWGGAPDTFGPEDFTVTPEDPEDPMNLECPYGLSPTAFDSCKDVPCPDGMDCSSDGTAGASNGGAAGAAGAAGAPGESEPLSVDLCPVGFPPVNIPGNWAGCAIQQTCVDPPTIVDGGLRCCYRVMAYHCR